LTTLQDTDFAVIDTETTGIGADAGIIELAVVHAAYRERPRVAFCVRINPGCPIEPGATSAHGITDADVADAPTFADVLDDFLAAIEGRVCVAYNAPFDYARLRYEVVRAGRDPSLIPWPWVDALVLRKARPKGQYGGNKLSEVTAEMGCTLDAHGAAGDTMATALVLPGIVADVDSRLSTLSLDSFFARQQARALAQEADFCGWAYRAGHRERPGCGWHEATGTPLPTWPERPKPTARCPRCNASPVTLTIAKDGTLAILDALKLPHLCNIPTGDAE
jgi:DNA polymerase III epsilon subunit-like protein